MSHGSRRVMLPMLFSLSPHQLKGQDHPNPTVPMLHAILCIESQCLYRSILFCGVDLLRTSLSALGLVRHVKILMGAAHGNYRHPRTPISCTRFRSQVPRVPFTSRLCMPVNSISSSVETSWPKYALEVFPIQFGLTEHDGLLGQPLVVCPRIRSSFAANLRGRVSLKTRLME